MKRISVQDLKAQLSGAIAEAEAGETWVVTRHNHAVAQLGPAAPSHVHIGTKPSTDRLTPAVTLEMDGRYLAVLLEDRGDR